jgi:hypothetical protein
MPGPSLVWQLGSPETRVFAATPTTIANPSQMTSITVLLPRASYLPPHTLALLFHCMPAFLQSALVSGCALVT